jgi:LysM repeat protein
MRRFLLGAGALGGGLAAMLALAQPAQAYTVRPGDTLWAIAQRNGVTVQDLVRANALQNPGAIYPGEQLAIPHQTPTGTYTVRPGDSLWGIAHALGVHLSDLLDLNSVSDPNLIRPGQQLTIPAAPAPVPQGPVTNLPAGQTAPPVPPISFAEARDVLKAAALRHGLNPSFVLAVADWESGYNQAELSRDGAIGMMQILPGTAAWAAPDLLGRQVDLHDPYDNADLGAALLRHYLDQFNDPKLALAAYYQGALATQKNGIYPTSQAYVDGIWSLRNRFNAEQL